MANFDIDALRAMVVGIDQGSFSRAAIELGRSQSAVSMQLKKLEQLSGTQLFIRQGRGLVPTEAGDALVQYARKIVALNDEAARAVNANVAAETIRLGLPQDFYDDVMPATVHTFSERNPDVHLAVRAGNNHILSDEIDAGRMDGAIAFFPQNSTSKGELLCEIPLRWLAHKDYTPSPENTDLHLVLFNHPCLFRQLAISSLDKSQRRWRAVLTTPSLAAIWSALRSNFGIGVRIGHAVPEDIRQIGKEFSLPELPPVELRLLGSSSASPAAKEMMNVLRDTTLNLVGNHQKLDGQANDR